MNATTERRALIVTGASSGIGRELALLAARRGYGVVAVARRERRLNELAETVRAEGGVCVTVVADVCDPETPQQIVDSATSAFGRIDVLVNNAGMGAPGTLLDQTDEALTAQWQTHIVAPLRITRAALPYLRSSHGVVALVGSGVARVPVPYHGAYCAAKAAVRAMAIQMRREMRDDGVAVSYIDPGLVATEFHEVMHAPRNDEGERLAAKPDVVARKVLDGVEKRAKVINAVPLHAFAVALGEMFPSVADAIIPKVVAMPNE